MAYSIYKRQIWRKILFVILGSTTLTVAYGTVATDFFRSNVISGNWSSPGSWQSSPDNIMWTIATLPPTTNAAGIAIRAGHSIDIKTMISINKTAIAGTLRLLYNGSTELGGITLFDGGVADELLIQNGGVLQCLVSNSSAAGNYINRVIYNPNGNIRIMGGGSITVGDATGNHIGKDYWNFGTEPSSKITWEDASVFDWNTTAETIGTSANQTYFPAVSATVIPILKFSTINNAGSSGSTIINGRLEINAPTTLSGSGSKTLRDGIIGTSVLTLDASLGTTTITSATAVLGGSITVILHKTLNLANGITVPAGANVLLGASGTANVSKASGSFNVNGTIDITDRTISNTSGNVTVTGILKTSRTNGLYNPGNIASGSVILNNGSTIEYNSLLSQTISSGLTYANLTFSGSGNKIPTSAITATETVSITGNTIVDFTNHNLSGLDFVMNNGRFIVGTTGTQPGMTGTYNLTGGVVEFAGTSNQSIRSKSYQNIEVTGTGVKNSTGNINLNSLGTFTIKPGGTFEINADAIVGITGTQTLTVESGGEFKCGNQLGFHGPVSGLNSPSVRNDIETINLNTGSIVNYSRASPPLSSGDQVITNTIPYHHLHLSGNGTKTAPSGILTIRGDLKNVSGTPVFAHNNGSVFFNGSVLQTYQAIYPGFTFYNFTSANPVNLYFASRVSVLKQLSINSGAKIRLDTSDIVLLSNLSNTANVDKIISADAISYSGIGRFVVERFIGTGAIHGKTWQLLSVPTNGSNQSINAAWQEGNSPLSNAINPGYGTTLTSNVANAVSRGFDFYTVPGPSIKIFNPLTSDWVGIDNGSLHTNAIPIENKKGYMILVRGDRSVLTSTGMANQTILRTAGKLYAPGNTPPGSTVLPGKFESVGNPYASAIDFNQVTKTGNVDNTFYLWDPLLTGAYGLGAYQTLTYNGTSYDVTPGSGSYAGGNTNIESGQAFLIHSAGNGGTVSFTEAAKATGSHLVVKKPEKLEAELRVNLFIVNGPDVSLVDGTRIQFSESNENAINEMDALKVNNAGENISIESHKQHLVVERCQPVKARDTLFYNIYNMRKQHYQLQIILGQMQKPGLQAYLVDQFLQTKTELLMQRQTMVQFEVTNASASSMPNRFYIVFRRGKRVERHFFSQIAQINTDKMQRFLLFFCSQKAQKSTERRDFPLRLPFS